MRAVLVTGAELAAIVESCPFRSQAEADPTKVHVTFLDRMPPADTLKIDTVYPEELSVGAGVVYLHLPNGMGRALLPGLLEKATSSVLATGGRSSTWRR